MRLSIHWRMLYWELIKGMILPIFLSFSVLFLSQCTQAIQIDLPTRPKGVHILDQAPLVSSQSSSDEGISFFLNPLNEFAAFCFDSESDISWSLVDSYQKKELLTSSAKCFYIHTPDISCVIMDGNCKLEININSVSPDEALYDVHGYMGRYLHRSGSSLLQVESGTSSYYGVELNRDVFPLGVYFSPQRTDLALAPELSISVYVDDPGTAIREGGSSSTSSKEFVIRGDLSPVQEIRIFLVFQVVTSAGNEDDIGYVRFQMKSVQNSSEFKKTNYGSIGAAVFVVGFLLLIILLVVLLKRREEDRLAPLDHKSWNRLPIIRYSPSSGDIPKEDASCSICLDAYEELELVRILSCAHHFHKECLDTWILVKPVCPLCQQHVNDGRNVRAPSNEQLFDVDL